MAEPDITVTTAREQEHPNFEEAEPSVEPSLKIINPSDFMLGDRYAQEEEN
jgi:hypothetical protein